MIPTAFAGAPSRVLAFASALGFVLASIGCAAILGVEDLVPGSMPDDVDAGGSEGGVVTEDWLGAEPTSRWYGPLRARAKPSPEGFCADLDDGTKWADILEYDPLLVARRIVTRLDFRYIPRADASADDGMAGVAGGIFAIGSNRAWTASTHAAGGAPVGVLVVDSDGLDGKSVDVDRQRLSLPLRLELEATSTSLRGLLYVLEQGTFVLEHAMDFTPPGALYDLSKGARARVGVSNFFGAQRICLTRVEIEVDP